MMDPIFCHSRRFAASKRVRPIQYLFIPYFGSDLIRPTSNIDRCDRSLRSEKTKGQPHLEDDGGRPADGCKLWLFNMQEGGRQRTDARGVKFERAKLKVPYPLVIIIIIIIIILDGAMSRIDDEAEFSSRGEVDS